MSDHWHQTVCSFLRLDQTSTVVDFGVSDSKGRALGVIVETWSASFGFGPSPSDTLFTNRQLPPGLYHFARVTAARDQKAFGASQEAQPFLLEEDRQAYVDKRVRESRARARKLAAR